MSRCGDCSAQCATAYALAQHRKLCCEAQLELGRYILEDVAAEFGFRGDECRGKGTGGWKETSYALLAVRCVALYRMTYVGVGTPTAAKALGMTPRSVTRMLAAFRHVGRKQAA